MLVLVWAGRAEASDENCFDFTSLTLHSLLQASAVQRLLIVVRTSEVDDRWAAKGLSLAARRRGVEVTIMRNSQASSARDLAVEESRANQAQMVAIIAVSRGGGATVATADLRDRAGQKLAMLTGLRSEDVRCQGAAAANPPRDSDEAESIASEAGDNPESSPLDEGPDRAWYGWQLMLADTASVLVILSPVSSFAVPTYLLAPPLIHAANGHARGAWLSVGLRSGIPLTAAGLGFLAAHLGACSKASESCNGSWVLGGLFVGMAAFAIVDDAVLAWKENKDADSLAHSAALRRPRSDPGFSVGVGFVPYREGAGLGMAGRF